MSTLGLGGRKNPRTFHLEMICHSGRSEHLDVALGGRFEGVETLLGCSERGRFVKAPYMNCLMSE
jgi:hypothetical protein